MYYVNDGEVQRVPVVLQEVTHILVRFLETLCLQLMFKLLPVGCN